MVHSSISQLVGSNPKGGHEAVLIGSQHFEQFVYFFIFKRILKMRIFTKKGIHKSMLSLLESGLAFLFSWNTFRQQRV